MVVLEITKIESLDSLIAKITLRLGRKPTQQEVLDYCIILGHDHIDDIVSHLSPAQINDDTKTKVIIDDAKIDAILKMRRECARVNWNSTENGHFINQDDKDMYTL
ncbi:MAG: hypothetical protein ACTSRK_03070 [Promethearchaeota archaeon]